MKILFTFCAFLMAGLLISSSAQTVINSFDNSSSDFTKNLESPSTLDIADNNTDFVQGAGSLDFNAIIANIHPWGTYTLIDQEINADWTSSKDDTLYLWIKVRQAPAVPSNMFLRVQLLDQPNPTDAKETYIFEDTAAFDKVADWFELKIPLVERTAGPNPDNTGFVISPSGWGLPTNNGRLDFDKITNYEIVAVTGGGIADSLKVTLDGFTRGPITPLPVELSSFNVTAEKNQAELVWSTATEKNNKGFEIERKQSNSNFVKIGFMPGNGTSTESHSYSFTDSKLKAGSYTYRLKQIDLDGRSQYSKEINIDVKSPREFSLDQNYPNPFNPTTTISYEIPASGKVSLKIYNALGVEVATLVNGNQDAGSYNLHFNGTNLASGIYFYKLTVDNLISTKKMRLLK